MTPFRPVAVRPPGMSPGVARRRADLAVTVVLPCRDEVRTVAACVEDALGWMSRRGLAGEVVVVDNGSSDGSATAARAAGARVVHEPVPGYGRALRSGFAAARGDVIVMADADGTYLLTDLDPFYDPIRQGEADVVMGDRLATSPARDAMSLSHRWGNRVLSGLTRLTVRSDVADMHCGLRSFRRLAMTELPVWSSGMEFATHMVTHSCSAGLRIAQTPVVLGPAHVARRSHLRPVRDGLRHLVVIAAATTGRLPRPGATRVA